MKNRFYFIGTGLGNERDITLNGLDAIKSSETVLFDGYTSLLIDYSLEKLEQLINKKIILLKRSDIEEQYQTFLNYLEHGNVALLVVGDPFFATTHHHLYFWLKKRSVPVEIINNSSILNRIIALTGLHAYKFGKTTSIPFVKDPLPLSSLKVIDDNLSINAHTLILLDIDTEKNRFMTASKAIDILLSMAEKAGNSAISEKTVAIVVARAGTVSEKVLAGTLGKLKEIDFGNPLHSLVIPSKELHFTEKEEMDGYYLD